MTAPDYTLMLLDRYLSHYAGAILTARNETDTRIYSAALDAVNAVASQVKLYRDELTKDASWTVDAVIKRLQKVALRDSVRHDPVTADNIRLAIRQLRRLVEPQTADTEPIDIFIFNS